MAAHGSMLINDLKSDPAGKEGQESLARGRTIADRSGAPSLIAVSTGKRKHTGSVISANEKKAFIYATGTDS